MTSEKHRQETICARTALRHSQFSKTVVLCNEDEKEFEALFSLLIQRFSPVNDVEMAAIEDMAAASWHFRRGSAMEAAYRRKSAREECLCDPHNRVIELLQRYRRGFQKMYNRAFRTLLLLRNMRAHADTHETLPPLPHEP